MNTNNFSTTLLASALILNILALIVPQSPILDKVALCVSVFSLTFFLLYLIKQKNLVRSGGVTIVLMIFISAYSTTFLKVPTFIFGINIVIFFVTMICSFLSVDPYFEPEGLSEELFE